jgi:DNA polymerase III alpha subunit
LQEKTIASLLTERRSGGPFLSLPDLMSRVALNPSESAALVKVGACDDLDTNTRLPSIAPLRGDLGETVGATYSASLPAMNRRQMVELLPQFLTIRRPAARGDRTALARLTLATGSEGMRTKGGLGAQAVIGDFLQLPNSATPRILGSATLHLAVPDREDYTDAEKLHLEQEVLGFSVSCNEMELLEVPEAVPSRDLHKHVEQVIKVAGVAAAGHRHICKDGSVMLFLTLQDRYGLIETVLFPDAYKAHSEVLARGGNGPYLVSGRAQVTGKGRGIGIQLPFDLRPADTVTLKMHPIIVVETMSLI